MDSTPISDDRAKAIHAAAVGLPVPDDLLDDPCIRAVVDLRSVIVQQAAEIERLENVVLGVTDGA